jgi:ADP-ribose pyrophosphatase YjhB (NUDIX family)
MPGMSVHVVKALIERDDNVLAVLEKGSNLWRYPGGRKKNGEEQRKALSREIREELGVRVASMEYVGKLDESHPEKTERYSVLYFDVVLVGDPVASGEVARLMWVPISELRTGQEREDRALLYPAYRRLYMVSGVNE